MTEEEIKELISKSLSSLLKERGLPSLQKDNDPQLFGSGRIIDSLDLVGIIVQVEDAVFEKTGKKIEVVDESSIIGDDSPFRSVTTLSKLIAGKIHN
jgi:acyl carrier protein